METLINKEALPIGLEKERLIELFKEYAYKKGAFPLASGKVSSYYFNSKSLTMLPEGAYLVALGILDKIKDDKVDAMGGAAIGAAPIAGSLAILCHLKPEYRHITFFIDRKEPKKHGDKKRIEGPDMHKGAKVVVIDDVATSGNSAMSTVKAIKEEGHEIVKVISLLDRKEGASELFKKEGINFDPLLTIDELGLDINGK